MTTIVTRAGKGSPLTNNEVDANFINLNTAKIEVVGTPTTGQFIGWNGTAWAPTSSSGTVTSVNASGGSTGLAFSGGPVTTSGTLTLGGTLAVGYGGTGATTAAGARINLGLGTAATTDASAYATAAQGAKADTAVQTVTSLDGSVAITGTTAIDLSVSVAASTNNVLVQVRNTTGATLTKGTVVYINGATGQLPTVAKAIASGDATSAQTLGMITADLANNANGNVTVIGLITGVDTSAYTDGQQLYLSGTTAGAVTTTKPVAPIHMVYVGVVEHAHPSQGKIFVKVQNGYELDELHDVLITTKTSNDVISYDSASGLWKNKQLTTVLGFTPENTANKGVAGGYASLDGTGKVPSTQLPSYVDDVVEYANQASFPATGSTGIIYVALDTNKIYRWSGSAYVEISPSPGSTDSVPEGSTNLYYTTSRARSAISASGSLSYNNTTGVVSYTQPTNVSAFTNDVGYITGITSGNVTTALGYTPANKAGDTFTGVLSIQNSNDAQLYLNGNGTTWAGISWSDVGGTDYMWYYGGTSTFALGGGGSAVASKKLHVHGGTTIGSGLAGTSVSANGLLVESRIDAPIYYDSNDTGYYVNPNGTSNLTSLVVANTINGSVSGLSGALRSEGYGDGNLTYYQTSGDFAGTTGWAHYIIANHGNGASYYNYMMRLPFWSAPQYRRQTGDTSSVTPWYTFLSTENFNQYAMPSGSSATNSVDVRAPIFYDSQNTGYYVDPSDASRMSSIYARGQLRATGWWGAYSGSETALGVEMGQSGGTSYVISYSRDASAYGPMQFEASSFRFEGAYSGYVTANTSFRAPIFYDSNDTSYYADPNSSSVLNTLYFRNSSGANVLVGNASTFGYSSGYRTLLLGNQAYTTVCIGVDPVANPSGSFNGAGSGVEVMFKNGVSFITPNSANNGYHQVLQLSDGNGYFGNIGQAANSLRSQIFYDSNNTGYYVDPDTTSNLNAGFASGQWKFRSNPGSGVYSGAVANLGLQAYSDDGGSAHLAFHRSGYYAVNMGLDPDNYLRIGGWSAAANRWVLDMAGNNWAAGSFRAPIFYDTDDTGYYLNPSSSSNIYSINVASQLVVGGDARAPIFYDSDNTNYFVNAASNSSLYSFNLNGNSTIFGGYGNTNGLGIENHGSFIRFAFYDLDFWDWDLGSVLRLNGFAQSNTSFRAPIFYDSDNTGWYLDPASTSSLNNLNVNGSTVYPAQWTTRFQSSSDFPNGTLVATDIPATATNGDSFIIEITGKSYDGSNPPFKVVAQGYLYNDTIINYSGINYGGSFSSYIKVFQDGGVLKFWWPRISYWNSFNVNVMSMDGQTNNTITRNRVTAITDSTEPTGTKKVQINLNQALRENAWIGNKYFGSDGAIYGDPFYGAAFYDRNDTAYRVDPASTSITNVMRGNAYQSLYGGGQPAARWDCSFYVLQSQHWYSHNGASTMYVGEPGDFVYIRGYTQAEGSSRAPIFYDSNNTAYYVDPNGTSNFNYLQNGSMWVNNGSQYNNYNENIRLFDAPNGVSVIAYSCSGTGGAPRFSQISFSSFFETRGPTGDWETRLYTGYEEARGSYRAQLFYDSNNTGYYCNPNDESVLNTLTLFGELNLSASGINYIDHSGTIYFRNQSGYATSATLTTGGDFTASGNVTAYSDARLKDNVETVSGALDLVSAMRGVTYTRKDTGSEGVGVIAQEMLEVIPQVVQQGEDGTLSVAYGNLVGVLIEAIKELKTEVETLKATVH